MGRRRRQCKRLNTVLWLIDRHRDALENELITRGVRLRWLGSPLLSWNDVYVIAANAKPGSPLARELDPALAWTQSDYWLQSIEYSLRWLVWAKTKDGQKGHRKPKPVTAPGAKRKPKDGKGKGPRMTKRQLAEFLARPRIPVDAKPVVHSLPKEDTDGDTERR